MNSAKCRRQLNYCPTALLPYMYSCHTHCNITALDTRNTHCNRGHAWAWLPQLACSCSYVICSLLSSHILRQLTPDILLSLTSSLAMMASSNPPSEIHTRAPQHRAKVGCESSSQADTKIAMATGDGMRSKSVVRTGKLSTADIK